MSAGLDLVLVVGDRIVAELLRHGIALAVFHRLLFHQQFRIEVGNRQCVIRQGIEQSLFDDAGHVDAVDHQHIPVAGLRLLDQRQRLAGALIDFEIDLDSGFFGEGFDQIGIVMIAPHQSIDFIGGSGRHRHGERDQRGRDCRRVDE